MELNAVGRGLVVDDEPSYYHQEGKQTDEVHNYEDRITAEGPHHSLNKVIVTLMKPIMEGLNDKSQEFNLKT